MRRNSAIERVLAVIVVATTPLLLPFACKREPQSTATSKAVEIGVVLSLTGRGETYGQRTYRGMQIATQLLEADPDFKDTPVRLIVEDSGSQAVQAVSAFKKLVEVDRVPVVAGLILSDEVLACAPIANQRQVVLLSPGAGSDEIRSAGDYVFRLRESGRLQAEAMARACIERLGIKEVGIMHSNSANGISYKDAFREAVERLGGRVVRTIAYNEGKPDYRGEIQQMRAANPPAVYLAGLDTEMGLILKQSGELGFQPQFLASAGGVSSKLLEIAGPAAEDLICGGAAFDPKAVDSHVRSFVGAYVARFGEPPDWLAANSFDAVHLTATLMFKGSRSGRSLRDGLYGLKGYDGVSGTIRFDRDGEVIRELALVQVKDREYVPFSD